MKIRSLGQWNMFGMVGTTVKTMYSPAMVAHLALNSVGFCLGSPNSQH